MKHAVRSTAAPALLIMALLALPSCHIPQMDRFDPVSGKLAGMGTSAPASVVRDENGVAHITAETDEDLFFAVGYAMAQDRFALMDLLRRAGSGRLSELLGSPAKYKDFDLPHMDIALRAFRFNESAEKGVKDLDPESRRLLAAYTRGVNRYLEDGGGSIAIYHAWHTAPAPWTMEDSFVTAEIMGLAQCASSLFEEYYLERIRRELGDDARDLFTPAYPADATIITRDASPLSFLAPSLPLSRLIGPLGSNNWAIAGKRTVSGLPLLCNDPHVPDTTIPTFWWHCDLHSPGFNVMGMMFVGFPAFGAATNGKLGWTLTNVMADYIDVWREKVNPENPDEYMYGGKPEPFTKVSGVVNVRGKKPVPYVMRLTRHGAVIEQGLLGWKVPGEPGEVLAMRYVDLDLARWFKGYQAMARAGNFDEWLAGARDEAWGPFAWNHTYADAAGKIAYWATGHFPIRGDNQGWIARRGWDPEQDWQGWVPFEENPHLTDPVKGYIVTANNRPDLPGYPYYITVDYVSPSRSTRITELIEQLTREKGKLDVDDMKRIQYDVADVSARKMAPIILADLEGADDRELAQAADLLREWRDQGYEALLSSRGTCVYEVFMQYFPEAVFGDELNPHTKTGASYVGLLESALDKIIDDPQSKWFDDRKTARVETRRDITRAVMKQTMKYLRGKMGRDVSKWRWADLSSIRISPTLVPIPTVSAKQSRGPFPMPGTYETVRANGFLFLSPLGFYHWEGPSTHIIFDFRDPRRAYYNCSAGMGDNEQGGRYDNLTPLWLDGRYTVMSMVEDEYRQGMMGELILRP